MPEANAADKLGGCGETKLVLKLRASSIEDGKRVCLFLFGVGKISLTSFLLFCTSIQHPSVSSCHSDDSTLVERPQEFLDEHSISQIQSLSKKPARWLPNP